MTQAELQALLDAGGIVALPAGEYTFGRAGTSYHALSIPAGVTLRGAGVGATIIKLAPGTAPSVRLLEVVGAGVTIQDLTLDGNRANQPTDQHIHGVFIRSSSVAIRNVVAQNFPGDGIYAYTGAGDLVLDQVTAQGNGRNGATLSGMISSVTVAGSTFVGNGAQQFDSEPGSPAHVDSVHITGSTFDGLGASQDYVLTICGSGGAQSRSWTVENCVINGAVYAAWASGIVIRNNVGTNPTAKPWMVYRKAEGVDIENNGITAPLSPCAIAVIGTGTGQAATDISITNNRINAGGPIGVRVDGAVSVTITGNAIDMPRPLANGTAIALRATDPTTPFASATVTSNHGSGWARGVAVAGIPGTTAVITQLMATGNALGPLFLDEGSGALQGAVVSGSEVARWPIGAVLETTTTMRRP